MLNQRAVQSPNAKPSELGRVKSAIVDDKDLRTKMHQAIRRIFSSRLESTTDTDGAMLVSVVPRRAAQRNRGGEKRKGKVGWGELGGEHLHFTIHKENKDTMEVISFLGRQLKLQPKNFQFAGTKDRRGITVQRASVFRTYADRLANVNKTLRNAILGDFAYQSQGLELGELNGNEFVITLRDCQFPMDSLPEGSDPIAKASQLVSKSLRDLRERGYFNYYGLQRFGTFATRTDTVGIRMLQGDFKGACEAILQFNPSILPSAAEDKTPVLVSSEDIARAEAINIFQETGQINQALDKIPRKFAAESNIIRHLGKSKNDYFGALQGIQRNMRLMYVHAYQSRVWNFAAGERWRLYGNKVVAGDLVLVHEFQDEKDGQASENVDADGEDIVLPSSGDSASKLDDLFVRARPLSAEEAASGKYTIFDIVLPLPGFDVLYPPNEMTDFYKNFMGSVEGGKLDPFDMRRKWKDISLSGSYRKLLSRPGPDYSFEVKRYSKEDQQFIETDLEKLRRSQSQNGEEKNNESTQNSFSEIEQPGDKLAVILKLQLGTSQYATMALRELMKSGGLKTYKPDYGGR